MVVDAEPCPGGDSFVYRTLFILEKSLHTVWAGQQGRAGWIQASDPLKGTKARPDALGEQAVPSVPAAATLGRVFSLRLVRRFPPSAFTLTLLMKSVAGNSLHALFFPPGTVPCFSQRGALPCNTHRFVYLFKS